ncbi:uncharacterized protein K460DRAFT_146991 [Cucurbitaria berberidis CBS 394.84]|uniref:Uncharacterized protein n=1 Tax=Cucurbitaria berberidis CBS 394.84 TaxID=1168544 RepID=A0A9P4L6N6_9PLEO|nr:uncharacterized protein K460DRAFT_146991 [Cucurbitaria berberidis CBS 394.84]KAF1843547.1 hypothetical protein K460DRAFT_146991 [Cucurbitaria berberidis CBS 394.84]
MTCMICLYDYFISLLLYLLLAFCLVSFYYDGISLFFYTRQWDAKTVLGFGQTMTTHGAYAWCMVHMDGKKVSMVILSFMLFLLGSPWQSPVIPSLVATVHDGCMSNRSRPQKSLMVCVWGSRRNGTTISGWEVQFRDIRWCGADGCWQRLEG